NIHMVAVSNALREFLVNETKVPKDRIDVVPNGIDPEDYCSDGVLTRSNQVPVIGSVGRLEPVRGFEFFIKAARTVMNAGHAAEFVIVGSGKDEKRLRGLVSAMGIRERFTFAAESADYRDRIRSMDVVVICPLQEGFGMTTLEAMACGKPIIASAVGGIYSMIKDGETGLLVSPKDPDDIAEKIISLLLDPDMARTLGDNARASAKEHFTMEVVAEKMEEIYRRTMAE
ncbi:MAG: glycosyltransferase family 4 protein, partial [Candidatus Hydrogenedentes bacterium]|nr:glycosyltransferase family 4 protein [Candidatus Hydrogenedentota bacterium]